LLKAEVCFYSLLEKIIGIRLKSNMTLSFNQRETYLMKDVYIGETKAVVIHVSINSPVPENSAEFASEDFEGISETSPNKSIKSKKYRDIEKPFMNEVDTAHSWFVKIVNKSDQPEDAAKEHILKNLATIMIEEERLQTAKLIGRQFRLQNLSQTALNILRPLRGEVVH
jgi:hypothetical protein